MKICESCNKSTYDILFGKTGKSHMKVLSNGYNYQVLEWGWVCRECKELNK